MLKKREAEKARATRGFDILRIIDLIGQESFILYRAPYYVFFFDNKKYRSISSEPGETRIKSGSNFVKRSIDSLVILTRWRRLLNRQSSRSKLRSLFDQRSFINFGEINIHMKLLREKGQEIDIFVFFSSFFLTTASCNYNHTRRPKLRIARKEFAGKEYERKKYVPVSLS